MEVVVGPVIATTLVIVVVLGLAWLFIPRCPECGGREWEKRFYGAYWVCDGCGLHYDPFTKKRRQR